jgi:group I intron endonuclease
MSNLHTIYRCANIITGKVYIGYTGLTIEDRITKHRYNVNGGLRTKFYNSIRKYGWDSFSWEVIYQSFDQEHTHKIMEPFFINDHNSVTEGYNTQPGGEGGDVSSSENYKEAMKNRDISGEKNPMHGRRGELSPRYGITGADHPNFGKPAPNRGIPNSEEQKKKQSKSMSGSKNPMFGKKWTKEELERRSETRRINKEKRKLETRDDTVIQNS